MLKYVLAMLLKFVMTTVVLWLVLGFGYNVAFDDVFTIALVLTGFSFVIGDLFILPRFKNTTATISDFLLSFIVILALGSLIFEGPIPIMTATFISALVLTIGEIIFHQYMKRSVLEENLPAERDVDGRHLQTEFSEELPPENNFDRDREK